MREEFELAGTPPDGRGAPRRGCQAEACRSATARQEGFILACLAEEMSYEDIVREYSEFPRESIAEVLRFAAEVTDRHDVAA